MLPSLTQLKISSVGAVKRKREREPDGANDELGLPDPYPAVSVDGAQWLRRYMHRLGEKYANDDTDYTSSLVSIDESAKYWDHEYRHAQERKLRLRYTAFTDSLATEQPMERGTIMSYTDSDAPFNRYLSLCVLASNGSIDEELQMNVHRLYKVLARCPRLEEQAVFLHAVKTPRDLPHNRYVAKERPPVIGRAYLNGTFLSTTLADPSAFIDDGAEGLDVFFDVDAMCCMSAITAPAGLPVLPLDFSSPPLTYYEPEEEVILPPGLLLVYQGKRVLTVGWEDEKEATVHFYQAVVPPTLDPLVETPSSANDELGLPDPYPAVSVDGAQWLRRYMHRLGEKYANDDTDYTSSLVSIDESAKYWDYGYRAAQENKLRLRYEAFLDSFTTSEEPETDVDTEKGTIKSYTDSAIPFNRYLSMCVFGSIDEGLQMKVHRLYKVLARCPRLEEQAVFLRSVKDHRSLPHNRYVAEARPPVIGRAYLNVTFLSTTQAGPSAYVDEDGDGLAIFFDVDAKCCMYAITAPAGLPVLPLPNDDTFTSYESDEEVILPPGLLLVYQGERVLTVGWEDEKEVTVHFYQAVLPPTLDPLVEPLSS